MFICNDVIAFSQELFSSYSMDLLVCLLWLNILINHSATGQEVHGRISNNTSQAAEAGGVGDHPVRSTVVTYHEQRYSSIPGSRPEPSLNGITDESHRDCDWTIKKISTVNSSRENNFNENMSRNGCNLTKASNITVTVIYTADNASNTSNGEFDTIYLSIDQSERNSTEGLVITEVRVNDTDDAALVYFMDRTVPVEHTFLCHGGRDKFFLNQTECFCDIECVIFHDCCVDAFPVIFGTVDSFTIRENLINIRHWYIHAQNLTFQTKYMSLLAKYGQCVDVYFNELKERRSYKMIDTCPPDINDYLKVECEYARGTLQSIPASLKLQARWQIVFRNVYCAMCHGVNKEDLVMWKPMMLCPSDIRWNEIAMIRKTTLTQCSLIFDKPDETYGRLRRCVPDKKLSQCTGITKPSNMTTDRDVCRVYMAPVMINNTQIYRNIHCAYCDMGSGASTMYGQIKPVPSIAYMYAVSSDGYKPAAGIVVPTAGEMNLTLIKVYFNFSNGFSFKTATGRIVHTDQHACIEGFRYDFLKYKCILRKCPFGKVLMGDHCVHDGRMLITHNPKLLPLYGNDLDKYAIVRFRIEKRTNEFSNSEISNMLYWFLEQVFLPEKHNITFHTQTGNITVYNHHNYFEFYFENHHLGHVVQNIHKLNKLTEDSIFDQFAVTELRISNTYFGELFSCIAHTGKPLFFYRNITVIVDNATVYVMHQKNRPINVNITRFTLSFHANGQTFIGTSVVLCSFLNCAMDNLEPNEYWISNGSLILNSTGQVLPPDRYEMHDDIMFVCRDDMLGYKINVDFIYDHVSIILQRTTTSFSIAALLLTVAIYFKSASVQTVHGKTLVSLSVSLIVAQVMGLLQTQKEDITCKIVAVLLHLGLLSAFAWMSMISYDMMRTFVVKHPVSVDRKTNMKRYINYAMISWGIPTALVVICLILDNVDNPMRTRYGADGFCFIANVNVFFMFYTTPHIVSLSFNIVAFIITVYSISSRRTNPSRKKNDKMRFLIIYFKLAIVMGLTWIFAILASVTRWVWLWYLSLILDGLQGVFVFLAFALRSRIWREMKLRKASSFRFGISFSMNSLPQDNRKPRSFTISSSVQEEI